MKLASRAFRVFLFLTLGAILSYAVAWAFAYRDTPTSTAFLGTKLEADQSSLAWPLPIRAWPAWVVRKQVPSEPEFATDYRISRGTTVTMFSGRNHPLIWVLSESRSGWPMHAATRYHVTYDEINGWPNTVGPDTRIWYSGWHGADKPHAVYPTVRAPVRFPVKPLWTGLAVSSVFYGALLAAGAWACGWLKRANRKRLGLCIICKYPVGTSAVCTECGKPRSPA